MQNGENNMIKAKSKYPSKISFVKKGQTAAGHKYTSFKIGDRINREDGTKEYMNYRVTVWDDLDLNDGDEVTFATIESIQVRQVGENRVFDLVATIEGKGFDL